jgi:hypothetical protein
MKKFLFGVEWNRVHYYWGHIGLLYQPRMVVDDDECVAVGGMIGRGNRSTQRKLAPVSLCPLQIPHDLTRYRTRAAEMESRRLTARATARPENEVTINSVLFSLTSYTQQAKCRKYVICFSGSWNFNSCRFWRRSFWLHNHTASVVYSFCCPDT